MRILKFHVDTKVDEQTVLFFYIKAFLLPEDEVTEEIVLFLISHPCQYFLLFNNFFLLWSFTRDTLVLSDWKFPPALCSFVGRDVPITIQMTIF